MKRLIAIIAIGTTALCPISAGTPITKYKAAPTLTLTSPAQPDSTTENPFEPEMLLKARPEMPLRLLRNLTADWTTMTTDTSGNLTLVKASDRPLLHTFSTRIRAPRFSKGKLKLTTNARGEITVNGKSIAKKTTVDSVASDVSGKIILNPEADNEVQVKILSMPEDGSTPEFKVEYIPEKKFEEVAIAEGADISRRFSTLGTMTGERAMRTSVSPDGRYMIISYSERFSAKDSESRAELIETQTGKVITSDLKSSARWMPGGSKLYYTTKSGKGYMLHTMDVPSLKSEVIARNIPNSNFRFTPDMRYLIYSQYVEGPKDKGPMKRYRNPDDRIPGDRDRYYIMCYDLATGYETPLTYGGPSTYINDISRDGSHLLYSSMTFVPSEYPLYFRDIIQMDLNTLKTDTLFRHDGHINSAIYSPDGKKLFICASAQAFDGIGAEVGNHEIPNDYDIQGYIYTIADKKVVPVTKNFDPSIDDRGFWNPADGNIYFRGEEGFGINVYKLNPNNLEITQLPTETQVVYEFSMGDDETNWMAYRGGNFTNTGAAYLLNLKTGKSRLVADPMKSDLDDMEFGKMEEWNFTSSDGTEINGYICLPPEFDPAKKYPLIVYYYGGTSPCVASMTTPYAPQVFASRDYVVYILNPSGTYGYGQEFSARHVNAWGKRTAEDIIEGVKAFCKAHPFVDEKKIGCCGASYGGFMTQYLQTLTDIFAAAVSHAGISNVTSYWGEGYWGYSYNNIAAAKSFPWNNPDLFTKQGSLFNADKIHTPLLLLHGTVDTNVPIGESIQLFNALRILGRTVEFVTVEDENHIINDFDKKLIWQDTIMAWFAKYLQDDPSWWDELYGD